MEHELPPELLAKAAARASAQTQSRPPGPQGLENGGGGHEFWQWQSRRALGDGWYWMAIWYLFCELRRQAHANNNRNGGGPASARAYIRQAFNINASIGPMAALLTSMVHLWAALRYSSRGNWEEAHAPALLQAGDFDAGRRDDDRQLFPEWGFLLATFARLRVTVLDAQQWTTGQHEKAWIEREVANMRASPEQAIIFACPLLNATRLQRIYDDATYWAEIERIRQHWPNACDETDWLEEAMAGLPVWVTRKLGLHASARMARHRTVNECRQAIGLPIVVIVQNQLGANNVAHPNIDQDPMLALQRIAALHPAWLLSQYVRELQDSFRMLGAKIGKEAKTLAWPYSRCNLCGGRGHGQHRGSGGSRQKMLKKCTGLAKSGGVLKMQKRVANWNVLIKSNYRTSQEMAFAHDILGEGCIVSGHIFEKAEVWGDLAVSKASTALRELAKMELRPPAYASQIPDRLGVIVCYANGRTKSTMNMSTAAAALEQPTQADWIINSALFAAATVYADSCSHWGLVGLHILGLWFQKRCLFCGGGGHYWYQCAGWAELKGADWAQGTGAGLWLRPQLIYHSPDNVIRDLLNELTRASRPGSGMFASLAINLARNAQGVQMAANGQPVLQGGVGSPQQLMAGLSNLQQIALVQTAAQGGRREAQAVAQQIQQPAPAPAPRHPRPQPRPLQELESGAWDALALSLSLSTSTRTSNPYPPQHISTSTTTTGPGYGQGYGFGGTRTFPPQESSLAVFSNAELHPEAISMPDADLNQPGPVVDANAQAVRSFMEQLQAWGRKMRSQAPNLALLTEQKGYFAHQELMDQPNSGSEEAVDFQWYLGVVLPACPHASLQTCRDWAAGLARALYRNEGSRTDQLFVWKFGRSINPTSRLAEQGLLPVFLLSPEGVHLQSFSLPAHASPTASQFETQARHKLYALSMRMRLQPPEPWNSTAESNNDLLLVQPFPKSFIHAKGAFRAMCRAQWQLAGLPDEFMPAYTEMFVATPAAIRYWTGSLQLRPQWQSLQLDPSLPVSAASASAEDQARPSYQGYSCKTSDAFLS